MEPVKHKLPIVERDAWLQPVEEQMNRRHARYEETKLECCNS